MYIFILFTIWIHKILSFLSSSFIIRGTSYGINSKLEYESCNGLFQLSFLGLPYTSWTSWWVILSVTDYFLCYFLNLGNSRLYYFSLSTLDLKHRRCRVLNKVFSSLCLVVFQTEVEYSLSFWFICFHIQKVAAVYMGTELGLRGYYYSLKKKSSRKSAGIAVFQI